MADIATPRRVNSSKTPGTPVIVDAVIRGVTQVCYNAVGGSTINPGQPVCALGPNDSPTAMSLANWNLGATSAIPEMRIGIALASASIEGPIIGVALDTILPGMTGEIAMNGSVLCVRCSPLGNPTMPLWAVKPSGGSGIVDLSPTLPTASGQVLGVVVLLPSDINNNLTPVPNTGSPTYAGVLVSPF